MDLRELWSARGLLLFLAWRDVKVRYAQTVLGAAWAVLQPLLTMLVFTAIFGRFVEMPSDGIPYSVFALSGLVVWTYFSTAVLGASESLVANRNLLTKVYFPRLVIPLAPVLAAMVDFTVSVVLLFIFAAVLGFTPSGVAVVAVPFLLICVATAAAGVGCWLAALNMRYRDVRHAVPFFLQLGLFASPIVYPLTMVPESYRAVYLLNPLSGIITAFRSVSLGHSPIDGIAIATALGVSIALLVSGVVYFQHTERSFADIA